MTSFQILYVFLSPSILHKHSEKFFLKLKSMPILHTILFFYASTAKIDLLISFETKTDFWILIMLLKHKYPFIFPTVLRVEVLLTIINIR